MVRAVAGGSIGVDPSVTPALCDSTPMPIDATPPPSHTIPDPVSPALSVPGTPIPDLQVYADTDDASFQFGWSVPSASASLDPRETSRDSVPPPLASSDFRHSFWSFRRPRLRTALVRAKVSQGRLDAWDACGSCAWVLASQDEQPRYRIACHRCHDRFCEACAAERRRRISQNLQTALTKRLDLLSPHHRTQSIRFMSLTLKSSDTPLKEQLDRLYAAFGRLRHRQAIARRLRGGIAFLELTLHPTTRQWHPHLHIVFEGDFIDQKGLSALWLKITGDSYIVDIRLLKCPSQAAGYVAKYASKGLSTRAVCDGERLAEAVQALSGRRTFNCFGAWSQLGLSNQPPLDGDWYVISTLPQLIERAQLGDPDARKILARLKGAPAHEPMDLCPQSPAESVLPHLLE